MTSDDQMMLGGGEFATKATQRMGLHAETLFQTLCQQHNLSCRPATRFENTVRHFDFVVTPWPFPPFSQDTARVEVKAIKCPSRGAKPDPTLIYVELKGVMGHKGWVLGDADIVAFEQPHNSFLLVKREDLARKAAQMFDSAAHAQRSGVKGTLWSRPDRQDLVLCMDRDRDVKSLQHAILK
jgi:hypothetical protein